MATHANQQMLFGTSNNQSISIVWLDNFMDESETNISNQTNLYKLDPNLKTFNNKDECDEYIRCQNRHARIILIVNGELGQEIVKNIHYLSQIISIYVYYSRVVNHEKWVQEFEKIKYAFNTFDTIKADIEENYFKIDNESTVVQKNSEIDESYTSHFISDYSMNYVSQIKPTSKDKNDFLLLCQTYGESNSIIQEFQEIYSSEKPLIWLKPHSAFTRILTRVFRLANIERIYSCRFFLHDIQKQFAKHKCIEKIQVYRGELMYDQQFQNLKALQGKIMAINSFYFTTLDQRIASCFIREMLHIKRVRFDIEADPEIQGVKPFIKTNSFPYLHDENGVIFMIGSLFKIHEIHEDEGGITNVKMVLCANENNHPFKDQLNNTNEEKDLIGYAQLQCDMGQYFACPRILNKANAILQKYLKEIAPNHSDRIRCFTILGKIYFAKNDFNASINYHHQSLEMKRKILHPNDPYFIETYNNIALAYLEKGNKPQALDAFQQSLRILKNMYNDDPQKLIPYYYEFTKIYESDGNFKKALSYHLQIYTLLLDYYNDDDVNLVGCYNNIGKTYVSLGQYSLALGYYETSLKIKLNNPNSFQPESIALAHRGLASIYQQMGNINQALIHLTNSEKIYREMYSDTHETVLELEKVREIWSSTSE